MLTLQTADMRPLSVEVIASPLLGPRGKVIGVVEVLRELDFDAHATAPAETMPWPARRARQEKEAIQEALDRAGGNITHAAKALRMHRTTLWRKLKRLGLKT